MQCTVIVHVNDLLITWKDEAITAGVIEALKAKYRDVQKHPGVKHSYLGLSLALTATGRMLSRCLCSSLMC